MNFPGRVSSSWRERAFTAGGKSFLPLLTVVSLLPLHWHHMTRQSAADKLPVAWMRKVEIIETPSEKEGTQATAVPGHCHTAAVPSNCRSNTLAAVKLTSNGFSVPLRSYFDRCHMSCHLLIVTIQYLKCRVIYSWLRVVSVLAVLVVTCAVIPTRNTPKNIRSPKKHAYCNSINYTTLFNFFIFYFCIFRLQQIPGKVRHFNIWTTPQIGNSCFIILTVACLSTSHVTETYILS